MVINKNKLESLMKKKYVILRFYHDNENTQNEKENRIQNGLLHFLHWLKQNSLRIYKEGIEFRWEQGQGEEFSIVNNHLVLPIWR